MVTEETTPGRRWHEALAYAVLGRRIEGLGLQQAPAIHDMLATLAEVYGGAEQVRVAVATVRASADGRWPVAVPPDLSEGLGAAQFWSALQLLRGQLTAAPTAVASGNRPLDADERRLVADAPPHHGS